LIALQARFVRLDTASLEAKKMIDVAPYCAVLIFVDTE
jgi:hypothetical protein